PIFGRAMEQKETLATRPHRSELEDIDAERGFQERANETDHSESSNVLDHEAITRLLYILEILFLGSIDDDHRLPEPQDQPRAKRNDFVRVKLDLDRPERTAADAHPPSERDEKDFSAIVDQRRVHGLDSRP